MNGKFLSIFCWTAVTLIAATVFGTPSAFANEKTISFVDKKGERVPIGTVRLTKTDAGEKINVTLSYKGFSNHFLNMFPFKCLEGKQWLCHLPYPHKTKGVITKDNLMDLEYALLFLHKNPAEYGIDFWNGVYYKLTRNEDGSFKGVMMETDMNELAIPPEPYGRPIGGADLVEATPKDHRFPTLEIK